MSLISYSSRDNREIVLRHKDAIVLRDLQTKQLILRGTDSSSHCPTCHQLIRCPSPERQETPHHPSTFISAEYFRLLQTLNQRSDEENSPPSPIRKLVEPAFDSPTYSTGSSVATSDYDTELPAEKCSYSIKKEAFSQSYFKRFFIVEEELGRGGKGVVLLVRHELDGVSLGQFACKRVPVGDDHSWLEKVLVEVQLLQELSHPNLVSYRHVWLENVKLSRFGPSVPCAFILQQYCNSGDLLHYVIGSKPKIKSAKEQMKEQIRKKPQSKAQHEKPELQAFQRMLGLEEIYSYFKDIASGLAYLHASNYIHRDLKPSNCLLHKEGIEMRCLISDFGEVQVENMARRSTGSTGTISYCAPEVLKQDMTGRYGNFTTKSDIFSLGMILYFMCFGRLPYKSVDSVEEEYEDITLLRAEISSWSGFLDEKRERFDLPNQLYDLLKRLLAIDPEERPSANDILTAIQTEKGFRNIPRSRHTNNSGLANHIFQPIKPPIPLVSTENGTTERVQSATSIEDDHVLDSEFHELNGNSNLIVKSSSVQAPSPIQNLHPSSPRRSSKPPLLMPPPSTSLSMLENTFPLLKHRLYDWLRIITLTPYTSFKLLLYIVKLWTLTSPCKPRLTKVLIWWPLVIIAALDLTIWSRSGWNLTTWMAILHFSILGLVVRWYGGVERGLCDWEVELWN